MGRHIDKIVAAEEEAKKEGRRTATGKGSSCPSSLAAWKKKEGMERGKLGRYHDAVRRWGLDRDAAKTENRRPKWNKPKMGPLRRIKTRTKGDD